MRFNRPAIRRRAFAASPRRRASRYGRIKGYHAAANAEICLLLQVETKRGLENLERIARVEGVDGVFVGPGDLSAALGYLGEPNHPEVVKTIDEAIRQIKDAGSVPGILTGDAQLAQHYIERAVSSPPSARTSACWRGGPNSSRQSSGARTLDGECERLLAGGGSDFPFQNQEPWYIGPVAE